MEQLFFQALCKRDIRTANEILRLIDSLSDQQIILEFAMIDAVYRRDTRIQLWLLRDKHVDVHLGEDFVLRSAVESGNIGLVKVLVSEFDADLSSANNECLTLAELNNDINMIEYITLNQAQSSDIYFDCVWYKHFKCHNVMQQLLAEKDVKTVHYIGRRQCNVYSKWTLAFAIKWQTVFDKVVQDFEKIPLLLVSICKATFKDWAHCFMTMITRVNSAYVCITFVIFHIST